MYLVGGLGGLAKLNTRRRQGAEEITYVNTQVPAKRFESPAGSAGLVERVGRWQSTPGDFA